MNKILRLITTSLFIVFLSTGCSSKKIEEPKVDDKPPVALYQDAKSALESANYETAQEILEALDTRYPFGPHSSQVQLDLVYTYYKLDQPALALATIDRFIRLDPTDPDLDYLYYMRGLSNMAGEEHFFQDLFGVDRFNRDPSNVLQAYKDFSRVITHYPNSEYATDARQRMLAIKNRLARYEISAAEWYIKRKAYIAAINRCKITLNNYPNTAASEQALELMIKGYDALNLVTPKNNAMAVLKLNYPNNELLK